MFKRVILQDIVTAHTQTHTHTHMRAQICICNYAHTRARADVVLDKGGVLEILIDF